MSREIESHNIKNDETKENQNLSNIKQENSNNKYENNMMNNNENLVKENKININIMEDKKSNENIQNIKIDQINENKASKIINGINSIKITNESLNNFQNKCTSNNFEQLDEKLITSNNDVNTSDEKISIQSTPQSVGSSKQKKGGNKKSNQKGMKDFAFKFPLENSFSKVEIPFAFQQNLEESNNGDRFHSYITIKDTPKLYLDISDDKKMDKFLLSSTIENLKATNQKQENKLQSIDTNIMQVKNENEKMRDEIEALKNEIILRNSKIEYLKNEINTKNQNNLKANQELTVKINEKNSRYFLLKQKYDNLEKEIFLNNNNKNEDKKLFLTKLKEEINKIQKDYISTSKYYTNKFQNSYYTDEYIKSCLQIDLINYKNYVTNKISKNENKVQEMIKYLQTSVNKSIGEEYEVKLYGSHATNLCLPWSDLDVVLCKKNYVEEDLNNNTLDYYWPLHELYKYLSTKNEFKFINYIGATTVPLIKIKTKENSGTQSIDISLQDKTHYGIKCVSLILSFKEEYEALMPMILALKNILKQANLNDPYKGGLSSYGLVLLVVHFLKKQKEEQKSLSIENGNLGRLFFEFLLYYGTEFDPKESIIDPKELYDSDYFDRSYYAQQSDLIIIDPLNPENNVAKNTRQFSNIRLAFMIGTIAAREECECGCHYENDNPFPYMNIEHCILKRIFYAVKRYSTDNGF